MKLQLIEKILSHLNDELTKLLTAANNAHLAATDEQSIAETQYDTLAIEAGYLAEGQSRRVEELKLEINEFNQLKDIIQKNSKLHQFVNLGSIVQIHQDKSANNFFFIAPAAAGFRCDIDDSKFTVITSKSPMGKALLGKSIGDEISVLIGSKHLTDDITTIK
jgi:transcription elongation GreA/GreB family factor